VVELKLHALRAVENPHVWLHLPGAPLPPPVLVGDCVWSLTLGNIGRDGASPVYRVIVHGSQA